MFDASLERLSVTETSYNNSLAERATRSTIQTLPATLPEPWSKARGPRSVIKKPQGPVPRSATFDLVYWRLVGWPWGAFTDRGPWAMFLGNVLWRWGMDMELIVRVSRGTNSFTPACPSHLSPIPLHGPHTAARLEGA